MDLVDRRARYRKIEEYRKRPLIVYATSTRNGVQAMMAADAVREFIEQIDGVGNHEVVDVLVHSTGGDPLTAWKLMSLLRERFKSVGVLVPFTAFSAATLFALGADEIVMHPNASLGPIDPQLQIPQPDGKVRPFAYEDVGAFLRFLASEAKITDQAYITTAVAKLFSIVDPVSVGAAKRASELSSSVGERLLRIHMIGSEEEARAKQIAENLNKTFFAHGDAVSRTRAKELQLKITEDAGLEKLIWEAYLGLESYMQLRQPFNHLQYYLADTAGAAAIQPRAPVVMPPNTPPQLAQQIWQAVAQQAVQAATGPAVAVRYSVVNAVLESVRVAAEYRTTGELHAFRSIGGEIQLSVVDTDTSWKTIKEPGTPPAAVSSAT